MNETANASWEKNGSLQRILLTEKDRDPFVAPVATIVFNITSIYLVLGANSLVIAALATDRRRFKDKKYLFVANLAISDLLFGLAMVYNFVTIFQYNALTFYSCMGLYAAIEFSLRLSNLSLLLIAVDQYVTITFPLESHNILTTRRAWSLLGFVWLFLGVVALLPIMGWRTNYDNGCLMLKILSGSYMVIFDVLLFYFPVALISWLYFKIFQIARRHSREIAAQEQAGCNPTLLLNAKKLKRETKTAITIVIVIVVFVASWAPMLLIRDFNSLFPGIYKSDMFLPYTFASCNSFYNPFIYFVRDRSFRKAYKQVLLRVFRCQPTNQNTDGSEPSATNN